MLTLQPAPFYSDINIAQSYQSLTDGFALFEQANVAYIQFARWLKHQQEIMKPKAFKALLAEYGMIRREATKFIKLAKASEPFVPQELAKFGLMMFSLLTPRYTPLWEQILNEQQLTQTSVDGLKKQMFPSKKRDKSLIHHHKQQTQQRLETIASKQGVTPQKAVDKALECYEAFEQGRLVWAEGEEAGCGELLAGREEALVQEALCKGEILSPCSELPSPMPDSLPAQNSLPPASSPLPTEHWRQGWQQGEIVVANSTVEDFAKWSNGQPLQITSVSGSVGSIQSITVINSDFQEYSTFGNWIEPAPTYLVTGTNDDWQGKIVKITSIGRVSHCIHPIDDHSHSTNINHQFLVSLTSPSGKVEGRRQRAEGRCDGLYETGNAFCPALPKTGSSPQIHP
ncbi:MAG: hypothetical protein NHB32_27230 [Fischerella sp. CENA71]|nr:hypothetical protein [Fischerella sp. CENA71]